MPVDFQPEELEAWSSMFNPRFTWSQPQQQPDHFIDPLSQTSPQQLPSPCRSRADSALSSSRGAITKHRHTTTHKTKRPSPRSPCHSVHSSHSSTSSLYTPLSRAASQESSSSSIDELNSYSNDTRPRCYDHGCGGKVFSCAENYRRHMRERDRSSTTQCPHCSISFSRKSNRDTHIAKGRCRGLSDVLRKSS
jgi:hypothetical protein